MTQSASLGNNFHGAHPDARVGLGYGQQNPRFHKPRQSATSFPYRDEDQYEDVDISDIPIEIQDKIRKAINSYLASDFLAKKDNRYFHTFYTYRESVTGKSISPMPGLYKKRMQVGGGVNTPKAYSPGSLQQTGSTIGYSHPHKSLGLDNEIAYDDLENIEELPLKKVRMVIRKILEME